MFDDLRIRQLRASARRRSLAARSNTFSIETEGHSSLLDMVTQDEFCHDLLMPIDSDWLVFGMT
jgi:hypothetical protein